MRLWGFPSSPEDVLEYHSGMLATWLERSTGQALLNTAGEALTADEKRNMGPYLQAWHPNIYLWGPKGDALAENYNRIIAKLDATQKTTLRSFMPQMLMFYANLPVTRRDAQALRDLGEFCGIMDDHEIWSPVVTCTDHGNFAFNTLVPNAFPTHLYWQAHFHHGWHDAVKRVFHKNHDQDAMEYGIRWYEMFVLGGEHVVEHPTLGPAYAQHVQFCQEHGLIP